MNKREIRILAKQIHNFVLGVYSTYLELSYYDLIYSYYDFFNFIVLGFEFKPKNRQYVRQQLQSSSKLKSQSEYLVKQGTVVPFTTVGVRPSGPSERTEPE